MRTTALVSLFSLFVSLALAACLDAGPTTSTASDPLATLCASDCDCPLRYECNHDVGQCRFIMLPGPIPVWPAAGATCQCPYGSALRHGHFCVPITGACATDCDCGNGDTCWNGTCGVSFGPVPECATCAARCGAGEVCDGQCVYVGGDGGGGGGDRPGDVH